jgi:hypothetical protein
MTPMIALVPSTVASRIEPFPRRGTCVGRGDVMTIGTLGSTSITARTWGAVRERR